MGISGKPERVSVVTDTHTSSAANKDQYKTICTEPELRQKVRAAKDESWKKETKATSTPVKCYLGDVPSPLHQWKAEITVVEFGLVLFLRNRMVHHSYKLTEKCIYKAVRGSFRDQKISEGNQRHFRLTSDQLWHYRKSKGLSHVPKYKTSETAHVGGTEKGKTCCLEQRISFFNLVKKKTTNFLFRYIFES